MRPLRYVLTLIAAIAITRGAVLPDVARRPSDATIETQCRPFFHDACSEAMGRWLPKFGYGEDALSHAKRTDTNDAFVYKSEHPWLSSHFLDFRGPADGTRFVYGQAGPPRGLVVYDRAHRIAYYGQGCCSWTESIAAANVSAPPRYVKASNLQNLATLRGVRLGQTQAQIQKIYGQATPRPVPGQPGIAVLAYTALQPSNVAECAQVQNFFLRSNHLILIQLENAC
jgi:hypothetical protein